MSESKLYFFSGPEGSFYTHDLVFGETILGALRFDSDDVTAFDPDDWTATEVTNLE